MKTPITTDPLINDGYMTTAELADYLRVTPLTIHRMKARGDGPPYCKVGKLVLYFRPTVLDWMRKKERGGAHV